MINLSDEINSILKNYSDKVYKATEEGLSAAEKILIGRLRSSSPKDSGEYAKAWRSKGKKYKLKRYVGNVKMIHNKDGEMPLSNVLEYSSKSKYQGLIKKTFESSVPEMAAAIVAEIAKE